MTENESGMNFELGGSNVKISLRQSEIKIEDQDSTSQKSANSSAIQGKGGPSQQGLQTLKKQVPKYLDIETSEDEKFNISQNRRDPNIPLMNSLKAKNE